MTCGTDLKVWKRGYHARMITPPAVFGHELAGVIEQLGSDVTGGLRVGARVVPVEFRALRRLPVLPQGPQQSVRGSAFQQRRLRRIHPHPRAHRAPEHAGDSGARFVSGRRHGRAAGLRSARHRRNRRPAGDTTVVIGCGPIGLKFIRMLSCRGVNVIALGKRPNQSSRRRTHGRARRFRSSAELSDPIADGSPLDRRRPRRRFGDRSGGFAADLGMGAADGAPRRHGESVRRLPAGHAGAVGPARRCTIRRSPSSPRSTTRRASFARRWRPFLAAKFAPAIS